MRLALVSQRATAWWNAGRAALLAWMDSGRPRPPSGGDEGPLATWSRAGRAYFQKWLVIGALIGVVAGVGAIVFFQCIRWATQLFLGLGAGYFPPGPAGEGITALHAIARPWLLPVITTLGGLLTGVIIYTLAPEAEGHGTDAAIAAFHEHAGRIRARIPPIKLLASAITIGSGGSAGREGPTAQIAAGFGSWLGDLLHLDDHDRRIAMAAGVGAGIGSIFKAPFGGALLSAEILYKRDFEAEALFPAFIASVVGFSIYGAWAGWTPVFGHGGQFSFTDPRSLLGFLLLGIAAGGVGLLYPTTLYGMRDLFKRIRVPNWLKPALGGLLVGLIGLVVPQTLGMGYGYVQFGIDGNFVALSAWLMLALVFIKILATSLTIGSGGSGGVFGPGMVIGGFLGGALWSGLRAVTPGLVAGTPVGAFVVVGMGAFFGGIAKAPLAVILMVAEMTGEYSLIVPAMLATMVAYLITGETSIYESQVPTRLDSPAHKDDYALPLLQSLTVRQAMGAGAATATPDAPAAMLTRLVREHHVASVPIVRDGRLVGLVTVSDLARVTPEDAEITRARQIMSRAVVRAYPDESLYSAWLRMTRRGFRQLAVVDRSDPDRLVGVVTGTAIGRLLRQPIVAPVAATPAATPAADAGARPIPGAAARAADWEQSSASGSRAPARAVEPGDRHDVEGMARPGAAGAHGRALMEEQDPDDDERNAADDTRRAAGHRPRASAPPSPASNPLEDAALASAAGATPGGDPLGQISVGEAMLRTPRLISEDEPVAGILTRLDERGAALMVVNAASELVGIVTRADLRGRTAAEGGRALTAGDVAVRRLATARPDETLRAAARRMSRLGLRQLPVVGPNSDRPIGLLRRGDVLAAYTQALGEEITGPRPAVDNDTGG